MVDQTTTQTMESQDNALTSLIKESGLDAARSKSLLENFGDLFDLASEWKKKASELVITDPSQTDLIAQAKDAHAVIKDKRIAVEKKHKELKEAPLREGQALDSIKRKLLELLDPIEEDLKKKKDFVKIYEENQRAKLRLDRLSELQKYGIDEEAGYDLGSMSEGVWANFLEGTKAGFLKRKQEEDESNLHGSRMRESYDLLTYVPDEIREANPHLGKLTQEEYDSLVALATKEKAKQEAEAEARKIKEALYNKRSQEISQYYHFLNDAQKNADYSTMSQEKWDSAIAGLEKKRQDHQEEQEKIKKENQLLKEREELQNTRFKELFPYAQFGKEVDLTKLGEQSDLGYQSILKQKKDAFEADQVRVNKEKADAEKAEEQRLALEEKNRKEKEELENKIQENKEKERKANEQKIESERLAALAPDNDKLIAFAGRLMVMELPEMETEAGKRIMATIKQKHELYVKWIGEQAATITQTESK
jgi:hypothetical protein